MNIFSKFQLPSSFGLELRVFGKDHSVIKQILVLWNFFTEGEMISSVFAKYFKPAIAPGYQLYF